MLKIDEIIITSSPILGPDRSEGKFDNHSNQSLNFEGQEIRDFVNKYNNVFICTGSPLAKTP